MKQRCKEHDAQRVVLKTGQQGWAPVAFMLEQQLVDTCFGFLYPVLHSGTAALCRQELRRFDVRVCLFSLLR